MDGDVDALGVLAQETGLLISRGPSTPGSALSFESAPGFPIPTVA